MTDEMVSYMEELPIPGLTPVPDTSASASEDFAIIAERVPSVFMYLSAGYMDERGDVPAHNPKVQFNEDGLSNRLRLSGALRGPLAGRPSINKAKDKTLQIRNADVWILGVDLRRNPANCING